MPLKERTKVPQRITGKHTKIGEGIEQIHPGSKNGSRNNKEITKGNNSGDRNPRKEIRSHRCEYHQQNTRDGRENLRCRRSHKKRGQNNQRKCQNILTQKFQELQGTIRRPNLRIIGIDENEDFQLKWPVNIFNKFIKKTSLS